MKHPRLYLAMRKWLLLLDSDERSTTEIMLLFRRLIPPLCCWIVAMSLTQPASPWINTHPDLGRPLVLLCAVAVDLLVRLIGQQPEDGCESLLKVLPNGKWSHLGSYLGGIFRWMNLDILAMSSWAMLTTSAFPQAGADVVFCLAAGWLTGSVGSIALHLLRLRDKHGLRWLQILLLLLAPAAYPWLPIWIGLPLDLVALVAGYPIHAQAFRYPEFPLESRGHELSLGFFGGGTGKYVLRQLLSTQLKRVWLVFFILVPFWLIMFRNEAGFGNTFLGELVVALICGASIPIALGELGFVPESVSADGLSVWKKELMLKILRTRMLAVAMLSLIPISLVVALTPAENRMKTACCCLYFLAVALQAAFPTAAFMKQRWDITIRWTRPFYCYYNLVEYGLMALAVGFYWLLGELEAPVGVVAGTALLLFALLPVTSRLVYGRFRLNRHQLLSHFRKE